MLLRVLAAVTFVLASTSWAARVAASDPATGDWPMWGGTPDRNMVSAMKGLPTEWERQDEEEREVGRRSRIAELRQSGGGGRHGLRRQNNEAMRDPKQPGTAAC